MNIDVDIRVSKAKIGLELETRDTFRRLLWTIIQHFCGSLSPLDE